MEDNYYKKRQDDDSEDATERRTPYSKEKKKQMEPDGTDNAWKDHNRKNEHEVSNSAVQADDTVSWPGWTTVRRIGNGSFGSVYEIEREIGDNIEKAALKVISIPQSEADIEDLLSEGYDSDSITQHLKSYLDDIIKEYSLMTEVKGNTNIVYCDDIRSVQHDDGMGWDIFIKMELLTPLLKALPKEITESLVIKIGSDICKALTLCEKRSIVHRDIKPQNIFVSRDGNYKLGDFGIAKTVERTASGTRAGTYKYMAPEVYNNQPYGHAADIYSLGLVLYWLLNDRRMPFIENGNQVPTVSEETDARNRRLQGEKLPEPENGSKALKSVVLKACEFNPRDRYHTAAEMLHALTHLDEVSEKTPSILKTIIVVASAAAVAAIAIFAGIHIWNSHSMAAEPTTLEETVDSSTTERADEDVIPEATQTKDEELEAAQESPLSTQLPEETAVHIDDNSGSTYQNTQPTPASTSKRNTGAGVVPITNPTSTPHKEDDFDDIVLEGSTTGSSPAAVVTSAPETPAATTYASETPEPTDVIDLEEEIYLDGVADNNDNEEGVIETPAPTENQEIALEGVTSIISTATPKPTEEPSDFELVQDGVPEDVDQATPPPAPAPLPADPVIEPEQADSGEDRREEPESITDYPYAIDISPKDEQFLSDLADAIQARMETNAEATYEDIVEIELTRLDKYKDITLDDKLLDHLASIYLDALYLQRDSLLGEERDALMWQEGLLTRCEVLNALYYLYGFDQGNTQFYEAYIRDLKTTFENTDAQRKNAEKYAVGQEIGLDFLADLETAVQTRMESSADLTYKEIVDQELDTLKHYDDLSIKDEPYLTVLANLYLNSLYIQRDSITEDERDTTMWQVGLLIRYEALNSLYYAYQFEETNERFQVSYVDDLGNQRDEFQKIIQTPVNDD